MQPYGRSVPPKGKLFIALEELKQLSDRSKIVAQHVNAAIPKATAGSTGIRNSISSAGLPYARPSFNRAAELEEAVRDLQECMGVLQRAMAAANAAGIKVQGVEQRLKMTLAQQQAMDISGADRRELQRRGVDTSLGGGALDRPRTALASCDRAPPARGRRHPALRGAVVGADASNAHKVAQVYTDGAVPCQRGLQLQQA